MKKDNIDIKLLIIISTWIVLGLIIVSIWIVLGLIGLYTISDANAKAINCDKHPIYCQIKKNSLHISTKQAYHLSNVIHKAARKHRIPTRIFVGILAQESGYRLGAQGCHRGLALNPAYGKRTALCYVSFDIKSDLKTCVNQEKKYEEVRICSDFGIGQIYFKTAKSFGFDIALLTTDLEYSINAAATVLADFQKRYSAREVDWWSRYNARNKIKRRIYKELVERYL